MITILKFGGTSVGERPRARRALAVVARAHARGRVVVVVSALAGVTNALVRACALAARGEATGARLADALRRRHARWLAALAPREHGAPHDRPDPAGLEPVLSALASRLDALALRAAADGGRARDPHDQAWILAAGERLSARAFATALASRGLPAAAVDASQVLAAGGDPLEADPDAGTTRVRALAWWPDAPALPVVTGFLAADPSGRTVLFGRGGSDLSATVLAAALDASRVEIWTDTDGVLTADPRLEPAARRHAALDPATASALARLGARVLHARTLEPLARTRTELFVRDSARPGRRGTRVARGARTASASVVGGGALTRVVPADGTPALALLRRLRARGVPAVAPALTGGVLVPESATACARATLAGAAKFAPGPEGARLVAVAGRHANDVDPGETAVALAAAGVATVIAPESALPGVVLAAVAERDTETAVRALHEAFVRPRRAEADVILAGARGGVGRALLARLALAAARDGRRPLRLVAAFDTRGAVFDPQGLAPSAVEAALAASPPAALDEVLARLGRRHGRPLVLVDATASDDLAARHAELLVSGIAVVTANKRSLAAPLPLWRALRDAARRTPLFASTTVGAGLPVLATVRALRTRGDALWTVRAALSGTLSFVLAAAQDGLPLSKAVALARERGLSEPHPAADLSGADVARKLLIVLRESGLPLDADDVRAEALVPAALLDTPDAASLLAALETHDAAFAARIEAARGRGRRLVYQAAWDGLRARIGLAEVDPLDPIARARAGENVVLLRTALHDEVPLVIAGPGAGADVTAAGLHGDLLAAARALLRRARRGRNAPVVNARPFRGVGGPAHDPAWA